jgi:hypothetical protein
MYRHRIHELTSLWVRPPSFLRPTEILVFSLNLAAGDYLSGLTVAHKTGRAKRGYTHTIYSLSTPATIKPIYIYIIGSCQKISSSETDSSWFFLCIGRLNTSKMVDSGSGE